MLYLAYQAHSDLTRPMRSIARVANAAFGPLPGLTDFFALRQVTAAWELISRTGLRHARPAYDIDRVTVGKREVAVTEEPVVTLPFGTLLHFRKDIAVTQPRVLVVAPLSGHFATLLRGTIRTLLPDHDVFVTDWHNARDVSLSAGRFGLDEQVEHVIRFIETVGAGAHVLAICQPCVQVLSAVALMAEDGNPAQPRSMTLMAGPVDTRVNPTKVNELATGKPLKWFERNLITLVPGRHKGAGRAVYPGFVQLIAFMAMNIDRHVKAHADLYSHLVNGETKKAGAIKAFYDEYFAVLDLPAEFYLETVRDVFQEALLVKGKLTFQGRRIDPRAIRRTALLTIEGERDDICAVGQTAAAHELCPGLRSTMKRHHMQAGVGHYGVFSGRRWEKQVYPIVRGLILATD